MDVGGSFGQYTVLASLAVGRSAPQPIGPRDALIAQWAAEAGFARLVVIKTLFPDGDRGRYTEHLESTKKAAGLQHPNIRQIHELGSADGRCYLAVEYLEGVTFDTLLRGRARGQALTDPRLHCALLAQACEGIHHSHTRPRLLHGALRPDKLFVTSGGTIKVLGLGLGELAAATADPKSLGDASRYSYMAPEQILGRRVDAGADVFALGIIAWEALTGRRLFSRPSRVEVYRAITEKPIPSPRALAPSVPIPLDRAVACALAADPNDRYKSAREFGLALEEGVTELGAPLSTVAIASIVDRCFSQELEQQRSTVQRARQAIAKPENDDDDIFEVPTRLYEGGFEPGNKTTQIPPEELELLAAGSAAKLEPPDPMDDILDRPTPAQPAMRTAHLVRKSRRPDRSVSAPAKAPASASASAPASAVSPPAATPSAPPPPAPRSPTPAAAAPMFTASAQTPPPSASDSALASGDGLGDLFAMPAPNQDSDFGAPPSPREFERPPETLSDVSIGSDVESALADDFQPVATGSAALTAPPTGLSDADAAAVAAGAELTPSPSARNTGPRWPILLLAFLILVGAGGFAYYELVIKAQEPPSPVQVESS